MRSSWLSVAIVVAGAFATGSANALDVRFRSNNGVTSIEECVTPSSCAPYTSGNGAIYFVSNVYRPPGAMVMRMTAALHFAGYLAAQSSAPDGTGGHFGVSVAGATDGFTYIQGRGVAIGNTSLANGGCAHRRSIIVEGFADPSALISSTCNSIQDSRVYHFEMETSLVSGYTHYIISSPIHGTVQSGGGVLTSTPGNGWWILQVFNTSGTTWTATFAGIEVEWY